MESFALSGSALLPSGEFAEATLRIQNGAIAQLELGLDPAADLTVAGYIVPGFIDLQINGAFGWDFTSDGQAVAEVSARLPATGVTAFLPTLITSALESYPRQIQALQEASRQATGAHVLGIHLEGPYLSPLRPGAHNPGLLCSVNIEELIGLGSGSIVRLVTLAPELPGALDAVRALVAQGIVVSAGHSNATYAQAQAGFEAGITWGTHIFNAMSALNHREPGLPGALLSSSVPCGLIADGVHVHPAVINLIWRAKGALEISLVTDAMAAAGMTPGPYRLADREVRVDQASARLLDGTLAGSTLTMDQAIRNMIAFTGCSLAAAVTMASRTPARILGLEQKGLLDSGYDADLVILDQELRVTHTFVRGELVYQADD